MRSPLLNLQSLGFLRAPLAIALVTMLVLALAYQVRSPVIVDVGGKFDAPFVVRFYDKEDDGARTYRWTRDKSWIELEATGIAAPWSLKLRANGYRPDRPAQVALGMNDQPLEQFEANGGWNTYTFRGARAADRWSGDNTLSIANDTFAPGEEIKGNLDPRKLGIAIDRVELTPDRGASAVGNASYWIDLAAPVLPPLAPLLSWGLAFGMLYATARGLGLPRRALNLSFVLLILALGSGLAFARADLGHYTAPFLHLALALTLLAVLLTWLVPRLYARAGAQLSRPEWAALGGIALAGIALKWGGMWYAQFHASDLLFHAHRLEFVAGGNLFFTSQLPDAAQRVVPYPPALYVFLVPFIPFFRDYSALLLIADVLVDALAVGAVYYASRKLFANPVAALAAAFLFSFNPVSFWIYSWGNHTNIWSQDAATLFFIFALTQSLNRARNFVVALFLLLLAELSHLGVFLSLSAFLPIAALLSAAPSPARYGNEPGFNNVLHRKETARLLYLMLAGLVLAGLLYYGEFSNLLVGQAGRFIQDFSAGQTVARGTAASPLVDRAVDVGRATVGQLGIVLLAAGLVGLPLAWRRIEPRPRALLLAWLLAALLFALVTLGSSFSTRYTLWAAPALALTGGAALAWLYEKQRAGAVITYALCAVAFAQTLSLWLDRVLYAYH